MFNNTFYLLKSWWKISKNPWRHRMHFCEQLEVPSVWSLVGAFLCVFERCWKNEAFFYLLSNSLLIDSNHGHAPPLSFPFFVVFSRSLSCSLSTLVGFYCEENWWTIADSSMRVFLLFLERRGGRIRSDLWSNLLLKISIVRRRIKDMSSEWVSEWINLNRLLSNDQWKWSKECAIMTSKYVTREIDDVLVIDHRCMHEIKTILSFLFFSFLRFLFSLDLLSTFWISRLWDLCVHQSNSIEMLFRATNASKRMVEQSRSGIDEVLMDDEMQNLLRIDITEDPSASFFVFLFRWKNVEWGMLEKSNENEWEILVSRLN